MGRRLALWLQLLFVCGQALPALAQVNNPQQIGPDWRRALGPEQGRTHAPEADLTGGAYWTDNARRTASGEVTDEVASVGLIVDAARLGTRLNYAVNGDVSYLKYVNNTYKAGAFGFLDGLASYALVPGTLSWFVRGSYNELQLDPNLAATPDNLETYVYATTGPQLQLRFGSALELVARAFFSRVNSLDSVNSPSGAVNVNSKRYGETVSAFYATGKNSKLSTDVSADQAHYEDEVGNFDRLAWSIGYETLIARTALSAHAGTTRITENGTSFNAFTAQLNVTRRVSPHSYVHLSIVRQAADSADLGRTDQGTLAPRDTPLRLATRDPLIDTNGSLGWRLEGPRTQMGADALRAQERYTISTTLNRNLTGGQIYFERRMRPRLGLRLSGKYLKESYTVTRLDDREIDATVAANWYAGRNLVLTLHADRFDRQGQGSTLTFTDNRVGVQLNYRLLGARR